MYETRDRGEAKITVGMQTNIVWHYIRFVAKCILILFVSVKNKTVLTVRMLFRAFA